MLYLFAIACMPLTCMQFAELTPVLTRRAQVTNWLLYFREELRGYTIEELKERRRIKKERKEKELEQRKSMGEETDDYQPPLEEVY